MVGKRINYCRQVHAISENFIRLSNNPISEIMNYYLVYLSSSTHLLSESELADILNVSRENNSSLNVTGILLYHEGNIIQVLEGEESVVKQLYRKIERDLRHKNVLQMVEGRSAERSFPDWSMGFKAVNSNEWSEYEGYLQLNSSMLLSVIKKKNLKADAMLKSFITTNVQ